MRTLRVDTHQRVELLDVTALLQETVTAAGLRDGALLAAVPHTTAGITINENADPAVRRDLMMALERLVPADLPFTHLEGNADAHVKAALMGASVTLPIEGGRLALGTWQGVYFCEFDGPRRRRLLVQLLAGA